MHDIKEIRKLLGELERRLPEDIASDAATDEKK
jgi:hypothetical protein